MTQQEDFGTRQLVPQAIVGIRRFKINKDGWLTGLIRTTVWQPTINEAECLRAWYGWGWLFPPSEGPQEDHRVATKDCSCGFYAFFDHDDDNHHYGHGDVAGIIEGQGLASVGTKGFRVEKATIVALIHPSTATRTIRLESDRGVIERELEPKISPERWLQVHTNYPDIPIYPNVQTAVLDHPLSKKPPAPVDELIGETEP